MRFADCYVCDVTLDMEKINLTNRKNGNVKTILEVCLKWNSAEFLTELETKT